MIRALALDLSKKNTGWAVWDGKSDQPRYGSWVLGSEYTTPGGVFAKLANNLAELHSLMPFERIYVEPPIVPAQLQGNTTIQTIRLATGLAATLEYFAHQYREHGKHPTSLPIEFNVETWRPAFIGRIADSTAKAEARRAKKAGDKRASARDSLKELTIARCRQLGFRPQNNDQADAIGILTYGLLSEKITPPWVAGEVLLQPLEVTA